MFSTVEKREYPSMPTAGSNVRVWCTMIADNRRMMHKMVTRKKNERDRKEGKKMVAKAMMVGRFL